MANLFEHKDRRVIPNWRSFGKTTLLGELNSFQLEKSNDIQEVSIEDYVIDWKLNRTVIHASDLLSAAISNDKKENPNVKEAAKFILANQEKATISQISLAEYLLQKKEDIDLAENFKEINLVTLPSLIRAEPIREKIRETKILLRSFPANPVLYVELSRYYSILGQEENSVWSMKVALHLAPYNRFVLRCATRLFTHYNSEQNNYLEYMHNLLRNSPMTPLDPWLTSAEISIATIRKRPSKFMKKGMELINSKNISPFNFTELASSIGTVELLNGSTRKSRDYFTKAMLNPNDNSLAQLEWASTKDSQLNINPLNFSVEMNFEAMALDAYHNSKYDIALDNAAKWFLDMPFSLRPIFFASNLASTILKDQAKSISFLSAGLISHPYDPLLLNNLAYALALDGKPKEAFIQLNKIKNDAHVEQTTQICLDATRGLALLRDGRLEEGRKLYLGAIEKTKAINNQELNWTAILNYTREEIRLGSEFIEPLMDVVSKIPVDAKDIEIRSLRIDVIALHEEFRLKPKELKP